MKLSIDLEIKKTGTGFEVVSANLRKLGAEANDTENKLDRLSGSAGNLTSGLGSLAAKIGVVAAAWKAFDVLKDMISAGIAFNATMETSRLGIGALVGAFADVKDENGRIMKDFGANLTIATELQQKLKIAALQTTASYEDMIQALQIGVGPALKANFSGDEIVEFTKTVTQAASAIGLPMNQLGQEMRALFAGDIGPDSRLAQLLFSDIPRDKVKAQVRAWSEAGTFFEEMMKRMSSFAQAGTLASGTFAGALSNLKDAFTQAMGEATQGSFKEITQILVDLTKQIVTFDEAGKATFNPQLVAAIRMVADEFANLGKMIMGWIGNLDEGLLKLRAFRMIAGGLSADENIQKEADKLVGRDVKLFNSKDLADVMAALKKQDEEIIKVMKERTREQARAFMSIGIPGVTVPVGNQKYINDPNNHGFIGPGGMRIGQVKTLPGTPFPKFQLGTLGEGDGFKGGMAQFEEELGEFVKSKTPEQAEKLVKELTKAVKDNKLSMTEWIDVQRKATSTLTMVAKASAKAVDQKEIEKERKRVAALREADEAAQKFLLTQERQIEVAREIEKVGENSIEMMNARAELEDLLSSTSRDRLAIMEKQLNIQGQLTTIETDRAGLETLQRETAEAFRHAEALTRITDMTQKLRDAIGSGANKGSLDKDKDGRLIGIGEAKAQADAINKAIENEWAIHQQNITNIGQDGTQKRAQIEIDSARSVNKIIRDMFEFEHRHLIELYSDLNDSIVAGMQGAMESIFRGESLQLAFDSMLTGFQSSWAKWVTNAVSEWLDALKTKAIGTPGQMVRNKETGEWQWQEGKAPSKGAQYAYTGIQAASALYGLTQSGLTPKQNAISGAMQGAAIGAVAGVYGAVIGAFLGAIAGAFTGKDKAAYTVTVKNGKMSVTGKGVNQSDILEATQAINNAIEESVDSVMSIFDAFPKAIADSMSKLTLAQIFPDEVLGVNDITKGQNFLGKFFSAISPLFKSVYSKIHSTKGMLGAEDLKDFIEHGIPQLVYDAYAPVFQSGLKELGVTEAKLKELFAREPGFDPKEAFKKIQGFVEVLVGLMDMEAFSKLTRSELMTKAGVELAATPAQAIDKIGNKIRDLADGFENLTTDQQIERGKKILDLEKERQNAILQYLHELKQAQDALFKAIDEQIFELGLAGMGAGEQRSALQGRLSTVMGGIGTAVTPAELSALGQEAQSLIGRIYQLTESLPKEIGSLIDGLKGLDDILKPGMTPAEKLKDLTTKIAEAGDKMSSASNVDDQIAAAQELFALAQERYNLEKQMLEEIANLTKSINESITQQIHDMALQGQITTIENSGMSDEEKKKAISNIRVNDLLEQQRELRNRLQNATTAQEVNEIVSGMQSNAAALFDAMGRTPEAAQQLTTMLEDVRRIANLRMAEFHEQIIRDNDAIRGRVTAAIGILETALAGLPDAAQEAVDALETLKETLAARFIQLQEEIATLNAGLLEDVQGILDILRTGLDGLFNGGTGTGTGTGTGGTKDPTDIDPVMSNSVSGPPTSSEVTVNVTVDVGSPGVYVTLSGTAENVIESIVATAEARAVRTTLSAVAQWGARTAPL